jgi:ABC-type lipopolysaccharide export system ATPase subunit
MVVRYLCIIQRNNEAPMPTTLKVQHLSKKFKSREVVKDVSLHVNSGEIVGLLGPNGAGNTH